MKLLTRLLLVRCIAAYHVLSCFVLVFLTLELNQVSGRSEIRTKLLLQNIRAHLAQKADEIVKQKECESGLTLCKPIKDKESEGDDEKSEEIPPPPKILRGHHKPVIKVSPKDVIQTMMPKVHRSFIRKHKEETEGGKSTRPEEEEEEEEEDDDDEPDSEEEKKPVSKKAELSTKTVKPPVETKEKTAKVTTKPESMTRSRSQEDAGGKKPPPKAEDDGRNIRGRAKGKEGAAKTFEKIEEIKKTERKETKKMAKTREVKMEKTEKVKKESKATKDEKIAENPMFSVGTFVFALDSDEVRNEICRQHSQVYLKQLKKYKIWALMMYDASAKLPSGILRGNVNQYGDFDECLSINAVFKKSKSKSKANAGIKGKYCLANIDASTNLDSSNLRQAIDRAESFSFIKSTIFDPGHFIPRFTSINWGLCVPSTCTAADVENYVKSKLEDLNDTSGIMLNVRVEEGNCVVKDDLKFDFQPMFLVTIILYGIVIGMAISATYVDSKKRKAEEVELETKRVEKELEEASRDESTAGKVGQEMTKYSLQDKIRDAFMAFSLRRNINKLFRDNEEAGSIECINGIKSVFTLMLYLAHKTIPLGLTPFSNRILLTKISNDASTVLLRTSIIYTDSFLLISGVLTSYNLSKEISKRGRISWMRKLVGRFIRLTPALFAVLLFYAYIWDRMGSGPAWNLLIKKNSQLCREYMWRNLMYIQNFFAFEEMCAPQTHQLALDMQLSLLAPLFVYLLHKYDKVGVGILQALFLLSSIMRYIATSSNSLSVVIYHGMSVSQLYKTANLLYGQALHRASPYLMGTIVGYYLKKFEGQFDVPKAFAALGWIIAFSLGFYSIVSPSHLAMRGYEYDVQEAAQYAASSPVAWSLALAWLIVACHLGHGGKLNEFLCKKILLVFSRISYSVYLTQFLVFFYKVAVKRAPEMFTLTNSFNISEFFIVTAIATLVTLLFDFPMVEIKRIILDNRPTKREREDDTETTNVSVSGTLQEGRSEQLEGSPLELEEDGVSQEDSQENIEDIEEEIEDEEDDEEDEEEGEGGEEENDEEEEEEDEEEGVHEKDGGEEEEEEDFELRPLTRSTRMHFEDEDGDWIKVENDIQEDEEEEEKGEEGEEEEEEEK